tara:strand:- start:305 stop:634 length:330 start_codon:yes stop_codon:yes gene_type:complete
MKNKNHKNDLEYSILSKFSNDPKLTQRELSNELGLSLGKTNYLIKALFEKGFVKLNNFRTTSNKIGYLYILTPKGIKRRKMLTKSFLQRKSEEYNKLREEIEKIKQNND